jgi:hypothetical protein
MKFLLVILFSLLAFNLFAQESFPNYCQYASYGNTRACARSHPSYCEYSSYSQTSACEGSMPSYCEYSSYANARACLSTYDEEIGSKHI